MRIAHFGTFDVENYGDLLFPLLLERQFPDDDITHFSPVGGKPWNDCALSMPSIRPEGDYDVVIVGGGNILTERANSLPAYASVRRLAYPSLWIGAASLARRQQIPLIYNAPGVQGRLLKPPFSVAKAALRTASYLAVRDEPSAQAIRGLGLDPVVVPDTALLISNLWTSEELTEEKSKLESGPIIAVHMKRRTIKLESAATVAAALDELSDRMEAKPVLVAIGRCHGDHEAQERVAERMTSNPIVLSQPASLRQVAAVIAGSVAYVGASLHGLITATAFGVPSLQVVEPSGGPKFGGFLAHLGGQEGLVATWTEAAAAVPVHRDARQAIQRIEEHWSTVRDRMHSPGIRRSPVHLRAWHRTVPANQQLHRVGVSVGHGLKKATRARRR